MKKETKESHGGTRATISDEDYLFLLWDIISIFSELLMNDDKIAATREMQTLVNRAVVLTEKLTGVNAIEQAKRGSH